jgi:hypothetical protein
VTVEELFIIGDIFDSNSLLASLNLDNLVHKRKRISVREEFIYILCVEVEDSCNILASASRPR